MMNPYLWLGRFVGTAVFFYSVFLLVVTTANLIGGADYDSGLIVGWIFSAAIVGSIASALFLLSIDGTTRFLTKRLRRWSWWAMFVSILLPTGVSFFLGPLTATTIGLSFQEPQPPAGRHLNRT